VDALALSQRNVAIFATGTYIGGAISRNTSVPGAMRHLFPSIRLS